MKKTILSITMIVATSLAFGQGMMGNDKEKKSSGGSTDAPMTLEGQIGWNASTLSWNAPTIRFRYFAAENIAGRLTLGIQNSSETIIYTENGDGTGAQGTEVNKSSMFMVGIGAEYHFGGTERLSPYAGLDIQFGTGNNTAEWDQLAVDPFSGDLVYTPNITVSAASPESMFGVNLVAGTDYYFAENFYLGLELGLGFQSYTEKEGSVEVNSSGTINKSTTPEYKSSYLGNNFISQFRLGWRF